MQKHACMRNGTEGHRCMMYMHVSHALDYPHSHWVLQGIDEIHPQEVSFDYNYGDVVYKF